MSASGDPLAELRARIAANDRAIVAAVNERLRLVTELWELKEAHGAPRLDPDRERRLREDLSAEGLDALVRELLALTKRELDR